MGEEFDLTELQGQVQALLDTMYGGYVAGDRESIDRLLDPQLTMFDSASPNLVSGLAELNQLRALRTGEAASGIALTSLDLRVRVLDGTIVATWWVRVDGYDSDGASVIPEFCRNSAVLLRRGGGLVIGHLHEDVWQPLGGPVATRMPELPDLN